MKEAYIKLGIAALLPVIVAAVLYLLDRKTAFGNINGKIKQLIYGVVFGILAIIGTEWGIPLNGAQVNCRDAAVLTSGLMFGAPAGIIAGLIGGVERWIAVTWGVGTFTRVACSLSTIIAGFYAALLRRFMFENKKPGALISLAIGVVMEIFHLTMVFITNMSTPEEAMFVVKACTVPMVLANGLSVMLAAFVISLMARDGIERRHDRVSITQTIQRWLLITVMLAFAATSYFVFSLQDRIADEQTESLLGLALSETAADIRDTSHQSLISSSTDPTADKGIDVLIATLTKNRHVGKTGYLLVFDEQLKLVSAPKGVTKYNLGGEDLGDDMPDENTVFRHTLCGEMSYCSYIATDGYYVVAVLPESEALQMRNIALYVNTFMEILVFAILFGLIYMLIKRVVVNQIQSINNDLARITDGDLAVVVDVRTNEEFASLSDDINSTVDTLKRYIAEASARIDKELEFAKSIQSSALPNVFPAFPKRKDLDIYASMNPAKEVGGDFYDFYMTHNDMLHFLIADVSGKGIPAAMFMMRAKTELKSLSEADMPIDEVFTRGNAALCEGNDAGMFVTAWQGNIDLSSGLVHYANAGHNPPLVRHANGKFEYLRSRAGFVLAGMDGLKYKTQELRLEPGDIIFLYTDGVTEATNAAEELYGEERLLRRVNSVGFESMKELCDAVKADVDAFVGDAPQFDDITMVAFRYIGKPEIPTVNIREASIDDIPAVTEFIESELEKLDCPPKVVIQFNIAIDEIFSNIVRYGYPDKPGPVSVELLADDEAHSISIRFTDEGTPYNPLKKEDPDVTLSADERKIGGLGIFMVKKSMDEMKYAYENDKNILIITKKL